MPLSLLLAALPSASAFCGTYVGQAGVPLHNRGSQVVIVRDGNRTTLNLAVDYEGDLAQFALIVPVPEVLGPDDVRRVDSDLFRTLDAYSAPRLVSYEASDFEDSGSSGCGGCGGSTKDSAGEGAPQGDASVVVEASFTEGEYDIVVLSAEESGDLYRWLGDNGYALPAGGEAVLDEYIEAGSYFFAAKVTLDAVEGRVGLSPLQFSYRSDVFSLPVRIGTISSPGEQDLVIYALTDLDDGKVGIANYPELAVEQECLWREDGAFADFYAGQLAAAQAEEDRVGWVTEYAWSSGACDPCSGEPPDDRDLRDLGYDGDAWNVYVTRLHMRYAADEVDQDLSLYTSGTETNEQIRYVTYKPELERYFPPCGQEDAAGCVADRGAAMLPFGALSLLAYALLGRRRR